MMYSTFYAFVVGYRLCNPEEYATTLSYAAEVFTQCYEDSNFAHPEDFLVSFTGMGEELVARLINEGAAYC